MRGQEGWERGGGRDEGEGTRDGGAAVLSAHKKDLFRCVCFLNRRPSCARVAGSCSHTGCPRDMHVFLNMPNEDRFYQSPQVKQWRSAEAFLSVCFEKHPVSLRCRDAQQCFMSSLPFFSFLRFSLLSSFFFSPSLFSFLAFFFSSFISFLAHNNNGTRIRDPLIPVGCRL